MSDDSALTDDSILTCDPKDCPPNVLFDCDDVFENVLIIPAREGGTTVQWSLNGQIRDNGEYRYILQFSNAGTDDPQAWKKVAEGIETWTLTDPVQRLPGVFCFTHYRLVLRTDERTYFSKPYSALTRLTYKDWQTYKSVLRAEYVQMQAESGTKGFLFKRRISGRPCKHCRDHNLDISKDSQCPVCYGTKYVNGYYRPIPCFWMNVSPGDATVQYDQNISGPTINDKFTARALASPILTTGDIWLDQQSSERFRIVEVTPIVEQKGLPVVYQLGIQRLPFSDIVYQVLNENFRADT